MFRCPALAHSNELVGHQRRLSTAPLRSAQAVRNLQLRARAASSQPEGSRDQVPSVVPSFVIPPPSRGSQYSDDYFSRDTSGGSSGNSGSRGTNNGGRGGGGRGGAFNLLTGGFFGPGGSFNLLARLRLLLVFWAWCTFMALIVNSVVKLCLRAASSISLPALEDEATSEEQDGLVDAAAAAGLLSRSDASTPGYASTDGYVISARDVGSSEGPALEGTTASQVTDSAAVTPVESHSLRSSEAVAAEAVEVRGLDDNQREYLQLLLRHSQVKANPEQQPNMAAWSAGIYIMILGSVAFLSVIK